jgi:hypothetical protein
MPRFKRLFKAALRLFGPSPCLLERYRQHHRPLAGPREGSWLPH